MVDHEQKGDQFLEDADKKLKGGSGFFSIFSYVSLNLESFADY